MTEPGGEEQANTSRLVDITLDVESFGRPLANVEHEREVAIFDILECNHFALEGRDDGPYRLQIGVQGERLVFNVGHAVSDAVVSHVLSLSPLKRIMKDYAIVCDSYYQAIRTAPPSKIQSIDMGRRALHDEGSRVLIERLKGKITVDFDTGRRLFTLICALRGKG